MVYPLQLQYNLHCYTPPTPPSATASSRPGPPRIEASRSHLDTPHLVELSWSSDQPDAEASTLRQATLTRNRYPCPGGIPTRNSSKREASDRLATAIGHLH